MAQKSALRSSDPEFNVYVTRVIPYLRAHLDRLKVGSENMSRAETLFDSWKITFPLSQDPATTNSAIIAEKNGERDQLEALLRGIYNDIPESVLNSEDRKTLELKERDKIRTPRPHITVQPDASLEPIGGTQVKLSVRQHHEATRGSMHEHADCIEFVSVVGNVAPARPEDCPKSTSFRKATHIFLFNGGDAGKRLYGYVRYRNESNEEKSGPWSNMVTCIIA